MIGTMCLWIKMLARSVAVVKSRSMSEVSEKSRSLHPRVNHECVAGSQRIQGISIYHIPSEEQGIQEDL